MTATVILQPPQVEELKPFFGMGGGHVLVAAVHPNGSGWQLDVHALPAERRDAIRAACSGELRLPRKRQAIAEISPATQPE